MPADNPQVGEIWSLARQPSLTTSGSGGQAVIAEITPDRSDSAERVILISELEGRRLTIPMRSFLLSWRFIRAVVPERCYQAPCRELAFFNQTITEHGGEPLCLQHAHANMRVYFWDPPPQPLPPQVMNCPGCNSPENYPGSGHIEVMNLRVHTCAGCRRDWVQLILQPGSQEGVNLTTEASMIAVAIMENRGLIARIRMGTGAFGAIRQAFVTLGDPPQLQGVPIAVGGSNPLAVFIVGHQPQERGVQRLGGQPDREAPTASPMFQIPVSVEKPFTNALWHHTASSPPKDLTVGATWWHKTTWQQAFIVQIGSSPQKDLFVKFRTEGAPEIMMLGDFLTYYQNDVPEAPCAVGEEWVDYKEISVTVLELADHGAIVVGKEGQGYFVPYPQFSTWRRIVRKSVYERLSEDPDDSV